MRPCVRSATALAAAIWGAGCGPAPLARLGDVAVIDAHAFPSIEGSVAAFVTIENEAPRADTVIGFETPDAAHIMLHRNDAVGAMIRMVHQHELVLPANGRVEMRSGELHLMLEGLVRELHPGDSLRVTLVLGGERMLHVVIPVEGFGE